MKRRTHQLALECLERRALLATVHFTINPQLDAHPISRFIYGVNESLEGTFANNTFTRLGGNRWTAYNWENNASNAGSDYIFQNDAFLGGGNVPGGALIPTIENASDRNAGLLVTVPINGYVAADKNGDGDVRNSGPDYLETRFRQDVARKGTAFSLNPNKTDAFVYQDEFVNWLNTNYPYGQTDPNRPIFFSLDNEPDLWSATHEAIHPDPVTYAELVQKTIDYAAAIKDVAPNGKVFGPANYGFAGYVNLQDAPDHENRDFQEFYLQELAAAEAVHGHRLVDVLDVHWYPEATEGGTRITTAAATPAIVAARLQAPRSLWDDAYREVSWIADGWYNGPINLLPRLQEKIDNNYAGTKLAITEYNYGGGGHISGGIAQADVLGVFGREGLYAANHFPLYANESFIGAGFEMFRNFDGAGGAFGNTSVRAITDNDATSSVYASINAGNPNVITLVAINKTNQPLTSIMNLAGVQAGAIARRYQLTSADADPQFAGQLSIANPASASFTLPAYSVSTIRITNPTNARPVIQNFGPNVSYTENAQPRLVANTAQASDVDSPNFAGGQLTVWFSSGGRAEDRLGIYNANGLTSNATEVRYNGTLLGTYTGGTGTAPLVFTWNAAATPNRVGVVLRHITYSNVAENPATSDRTLQMQLTDGEGGTSAAVSKTISVVAVNDRPVLGAIGGSVGYTQNQAAILIAAAATVADVDRANFAGGTLTVQITAGIHASNRLVIGAAFTVDGDRNLISDGNIVGTLNPNYGVGDTRLEVTWNAQANAVTVQQFLRALRFSTVNGTSTATRTISFSLTDGDGGTSLTRTRQVTVK